MLEALDAIAKILLQRLAEANVHGHTLTLKVKFADYTQITRARTLEECVEGEKVGAIAQELLRENVGEEPVRLLGLTISNFDGGEQVPKQLCLNLQTPELSALERW